MLKNEKGFTLIEIIAVSGYFGNFSRSGRSKVLICWTSQELLPHRRAIAELKSRASADYGQIAFIGPES